MPVEFPVASPRPALLALALALSLGWMGGPAAAQSPTPTPGTAAPVSAEAAAIQKLIREGQHAQALVQIDEALARNPKDAQMRFRRGVALSMLDRKPEALQVFQKLVEDHPDMPSPYNNMAVIHGSMGDYDKAREALDKAIRTNPAYATAYQNLGDVYAQLASQAYNKALQLDKNDRTVPPKLALLRELTSGPNVAPPAQPAPQAKRAPATTVAAAPATPVPATVAASTASPAAAANSNRPAASATSAASAPASTTAAAKPAPAAAAPNDAEAAVEAAVKAWASAWSRRDMDDYYAAYAAEFKGQAATRKVWEQERRDRIASRKKIKVEISDLKVEVKGDNATARFRQGYSSDSLSTSSRKTLQLERGDRGKWRIRQESVGG